MTMILDNIGGLYIAFLWLAALVMILWILLPFAVFGIKPLMKELLTEMRKISKALGDHAQTRR